MSSENTATTTWPACKYPGCGQHAAPATGPGRPPEYCEGRGHTKVTAWRERRRLAAERAGTTVSAAETGSPVTMAKVTGAELLRSLRGEADRLSGIADRLRDAVATVTDPTAAEAEVEAVRAAAEQRAAAAEARAAAAEQRAAEADQLTPPPSRWPGNWLLRRPAPRPPGKHAPPLRPAGTLPLPRPGRTPRRGCPPPTPSETPRSAAAAVAGPDRPALAGTSRPGGQVTACTRSPRRERALRRPVAAQLYVLVRGGAQPRTGMQLVDAARGLVVVKDRAVIEPGDALAANPGGERGAGMSWGSSRLTSSPSTGRQQAGRAASTNRTLVAPAPAGPRQLPRSFEREAGAVLLVRWKKPVPYPGASISLVRYAPRALDHGDCSGEKDVISDAIACPGARRGFQLADAAGATPRPGVLTRRQEDPAVAAQRAAQIIRAGAQSRSRAESVPACPPAAASCVASAPP